MTAFLTVLNNLTEGWDNAPMPSPVILKFALVWYGLLSIMLFGLYGLDKAQAIAEGRRIPEKTMHQLALLGGFPGGLLGRTVFHHKTRKPAFILVLLGSTAIHSILWIILVTQFSYY